jgi:cell filamentation protein
MERINKITEYKDKTIDDNGVLINKLGINDQVALEKVERIITTLKLKILYLDNKTGNFDVNHYLSIHKYLFEDIYPFAGEIRSEIIVKRIPFCLPNLIYSNLKEVLVTANNQYKQIKNKEDLVKFIATLYSNLDVIHPFREGNGRCEREFIRQYIKKIVKEQELDNYIIDYSKIDNKEELINAITKADITCDTTDLEKVLSQLIVTPLDKTKNKKLSKKRH